MPRNRRIYGPYGLVCHVSKLETCRRIRLVKVSGPCFVSQTDTGRTGTGQQGMRGIVARNGKQIGFRGSRAYRHFRCATTCSWPVTAHCVSEEDGFLKDALLPKHTSINSRLREQKEPQAWASSSISAQNLTTSTKAQTTVRKDLPLLFALAVTLLPNFPMTFSQRSWCRSRRIPRTRRTSLARGLPSVRDVCCAT